MRPKSVDLRLAVGLPSHRRLDTGAEIHNLRAIISATSWARIMVGYEARPGGLKKQQYQNNQQK